MDLDLDEMQIDVTLLQLLEGGLAQLEMAFLPCSTDPMVFDLGICTLMLTPELFDRLVDRCLLYRKDDPGANTFLSSQDMELYQLGLLEIKDKSSEICYFMGSPTTTTTTHDVLITSTGRVILKLAGVMGVIGSFVRHGRFSLLEALLSRIDREWLPELLAHGTSRVREIALARLAQLEEE